MSPKNFAIELLIWLRMKETEFAEFKDSEEYEQLLLAKFENTILNAVSQYKVSGIIE